MEIARHISLKDKNWFKTGGHANYFAQPTTAHEFAQAVAYAQQNHLATFILGQGANILISDAGFDGLVIQPQLKEIAIESLDENYAALTVGAGVSIHDLIDYCLEHNLLGLEEFSGIPSSIGGALYINLHYFEFLIEQFLLHAHVIHKETREIITVDRSWFNFGYNKSRLQTEPYFLISATFKLKKATDLETAFAKGRRKEIIRHRASRYPAANTCGSFFRNFYIDEVTLISNGKKMIYVAYYLDKIGVKGQLKVGDAIVSYQHANMLVNQGNATSADIINLARTMQELVLKQFGITPKAECELVGFKEYPLLF